MAMSGATPKHLFFLNLTDTLEDDEEQVKHCQCYASQITWSKTDCIEIVFVEKFFYEFF